jgi:FkbM family methyltransferase
VGTNTWGVKFMIVTTHEGNYNFKIRDSEDDPSDSHDLDYKVINETWIENVYRIHEYHFSGDKVFIDIGANIGSVTLYVDNFNKYLEEKITVYAVEPEKNNLDLLNYNILNNTTENITVVDSAIWYKEDTLAVSNKGGNSSIVYETDGDFSYVKAITLEQLFDKYKIKEVDVMKIDIEGAEFDLIINTPPEILAKIKYITLEFDKSFDGRFGIMVEKLSKQFGIDILGSPERGGYIYANRY